MKPRSCSVDTKQTILIVDDVKENIDLLVGLLAHYDLVTALDGATALKIVQAEEIDLILLDIMMPNIDGFEICLRLKENAQTSHIPIIFLSAKDSHDDIQKGFEIGGVDYITKPFNPNELLSRVSTHLKLRAYEKNLENKVSQALEKNKLKQQLIHQQSKQAALGELLMHIAHQWKQPLAVLSSINLLTRSQVEEDMILSKEDLLSKTQKIENLIDFMSDTVETFRHFYQPSSINADFSLTDATNKVLNISDATLLYEDITISLISHEKNLTYGNENEFTQIVLSIMNNARDIFKHRTIKNPHIKIEICDRKISISDNGGGIDKEMNDKLFLPFKSTTNGNGIGLYIVKEIVDKNGGIISVDNEDQGTKFTVEFLTWLD